MKSFKLILLLLTSAFSQSMTFFLCEGNFQSSNASLWYLNQNHQLNEAPQNPIGDTAQSMTVHENKLYVILNGSGVIHIYEISETEIEFDHTMNLEFSSPRYLLVMNNIGYLTEWGSNQITVIDLLSESVITTIPAGGMPEHIISDGEFIYAGLNMNADWTAADIVLKIDPSINEIIDEFTVGSNPESMVIIDEILYTSSTTYDEYWTPQYLMASVDLNNPDENFQIYIDNSGLSFGPDIVSVNGQLYRGTSAGAVEIDPETLMVIEGSEIGNFDNVYSMDYHNGNFYFGITDFSAPDEIVIVDINTHESETFNVGAIPGSFAFWSSELSYETAIIPNKFIIEKIYPNPFNPETMIEFIMNEKSMVEISVLNIQGREIDNLYNGYLNAGQHDIHWQPDHLSSGVYLVQFITPHQSLSKPVVLKK